MHISIHVDGMLCWCYLFMRICHKRSLITLCVSLIFYFWTDRNTLKMFFPLCHLGHLCSHTNITHKFRLKHTCKHFYCSDALVHPKFNLLEWDCESECEYSCMWNTVSLFQQHGVKIPQFYGKVNIADIQQYNTVWLIVWFTTSNRAGIIKLYPSLKLLLTDL